MATTTIATITKKSSELREGDIVHRYGMRLLLGPVRISDFHAREIGPVYYADGTVLNPDEVRAEDFVPEGWWREGWTVQGNDLVNWTVEVAD